jgi:hypothetical protein
MIFLGFRDLGQNNWGQIVFFCRDLWQPDFPQAL